jgi:hypothetical protein
MATTILHMVMHFQNLNFLHADLPELVSETNRNSVLTKDVQNVSSPSQTADNYSSYSSV